jgi:hypothetical protein
LVCSYVEVRTQRLLRGSGNVRRDLWGIVEGRLGRGPELKKQ